MSERLGHANPDFTVATYQYVLPGMGADATHRFRDLLATRLTSTGSTVRKPPKPRTRDRVPRQVERRERRLTKVVHPHGTHGCRIGRPSPLPTDVSTIWPERWAELRLTGACIASSCT